MNTSAWIGAVLCAGIAWYLRLFLRLWLPPPQKGSIAFFHPAASGGGGGERVLWVAVAALVKEFPNKKLYVYCEVGHEIKQLQDTVLQQFGIHVSDNVSIVALHHTDLLHPQRWPRFTLLGQAMGSLCVAWSGLKQIVPELWIDTSGWAMPFPIVWLAGAKVAAYVHYPTISADMLSRVWRRDSLYNNNEAVSSSIMRTLLKFAYYRLFAVLYSLLGAFPALAMVNSTWTQGHIERLWWCCQWRRAVVLHPPCDVTALIKFPLHRPLKLLVLCSVAQFRPEKNHKIQLQALHRAKALIRQRQSGKLFDRVKVYFVGGCRNVEDEGRLQALRDLSVKLGLETNVEFCPNAPVATVHRVLSISVAGLHSMLDEHFGISIVEYMAAACIPIANDSAGPQMDIVRPCVRAGTPPPAQQPVGFLASSVEEYAECIARVLMMREEQQLEISAEARAKSLQFSGERFEERWVACLRRLL